jgi:hypothetical protein
MSRRTREDLKMILWIVLIVALLALGIYQGVRLWRECLDFGHSVLYCAQVLD